MDWGPVLIIALPAFFGMVGTIVNTYLIHRVHKDFNGKMDKTMEILADAEFAKGVKSEKENPTTVQDNRHE